MNGCDLRSAGVNGKVQVSKDLDRDTVVITMTGGIVTEPTTYNLQPPRSRLEAEGYAVFGLTGTEDGELYRDAIVRLYIPESALPYHCFTRVRWRCEKGWTY